MTSKERLQIKKVIHPVKTEIKWRKIHKITSCAWTRKEKKKFHGRDKILYSHLNILTWKGG